MGVWEGSSEPFSQSLFVIEIVIETLSARTLARRRFESPSILDCDNDFGYDNDRERPFRRETRTLDEDATEARELEISRISARGSFGAAFTATIFTLLGYTVSPCRGEIRQPTDLRDADWLPRERGAV